MASHDEISYSVVLNTPNILTVEIATVDYRAADVIQYHFDLSTGDIITLDQIIEPSKLDEIKKLVSKDSKKRLAQVKNKVVKDIGNDWYEKSPIDESYEDNWQKEMKKNIGK